MIRKSLGEKIFDVCNYIFLALLSFICVYPMYYVLVASLSNGGLLAAHGGLLWYPLQLSWDAYKVVFNNPMIGSGYLNTMFVLVVGVSINILMTALAAYVLSRRGYRLKHFFGRMVVFTMYFSGGMIPTYLVVKGLGMYDSLFALIIPNAINTYNMILMRSSFDAVPVSLEESAKLDGASDLTILFKIILPLTMPTVAVMILYYGVAHWNSWFSAMIYLQDRSKYPLQLVLRELLIENSSDAMGGMGADNAGVAETVKYATIMVATVPILCAYPFLQRYFVKGVMVGAVKG